MNHTLFISLAVVVDLVVTLAVINWVIRKRGMLGMFGASLEKAKAFSDSAGELTANYLRSNYNGDPESLPGVLDALLAQFDQKAQEQGLTLNRTAMKIVLMHTLAAQDVVPQHDATTALKKVA